MVESPKVDGELVLFDRVPVVDETKGAEAGPELRIGEIVIAGVTRVDVLKVGLMIADGTMGG